MAVNSVNIAIGAGTVATSYRAAARPTVTIKAATTPTTTTFTLTSAEATKISVDDYVQLTPTAATATNLATEASGLPRVVNIAVAGADFLVTVSPALGSVPALTAGAITIMYEDRGATTGPIVFNIKTTLTKIEVEQMLDPVEAIRTAREISCVIPLAEATYENLAFCSGEVPPAAGATTLDIGASLPAAARADRVVLRIPAPSGLWRTIVINKGVSESEATLNAAKAAQSAMTATITVLPDTTMTPALVSMKDAA